ncbi:hypothetical protein ACH4L5_36935 [Streptomyces sp. NPDC017405]|uniref:hypothetical protein n=1 Tax=unclassified Streptomyces TaxID=2593676 RepID=UPI0037B9F4F4
MPSAPWTATRRGASGLPVPHCLCGFEELGFEVGDALVREPEIRSCTFESFLELAMLLGQLLDSVLESGVLTDQLLDGLARDHLVEVADLPHELTHPLPLDQDLFLGASGITAAAAVCDRVLDKCASFRVLVEERGGFCSTF